jgi:LemA protein
MNSGSTQTWLSAEEYKDGPIYTAGRMGVMIWWKDKPFCVGRGPADCQVAASFGYCSGSCASLVQLVDFPQKNMTDTNFLDAIDLSATVPDLGLQNCPCHTFVQIRSYSRTGRTWTLDVRNSSLGAPAPAKPDVTRPFIEYLDGHPLTYLWILLFLAGGVVLFSVIGMHNGLIDGRNAANQAWASLDAELKRRHDLIPNLVSVVQAYAAHEQAVLMQLTQARSAILSAADSPSSRLQPETELVTGLRQMFAVSENYPQLKADRNFYMLGQELVNTEDRIQAARRFYNAMVREYDTSLGSFPTNLVGAAWHFAPEPYFELEPAIRTDAEQAPPLAFRQPGQSAA